MNIECWVSREGDDQRGRNGWTTDQWLMEQAMAIGSPSHDCRAADEEMR